MDSYIINFHFIRPLFSTIPSFQAISQNAAMGRAFKWLTNLLGGKKDGREQKERTPLSAAALAPIDNQNEKNMWSFKSGRISSDAAWLRSLYAEKEKEQRKHAIAVAVATAAAAEAAVAAAQAAVAVVRLTSQSRRMIFSGIHERLAAVKIQTAFRGYLAKKALRGLKALVKLQALVRGYLVRKQAAATFLSIQALMRAQSTVRAHKCRSLPRKSRSSKQLQESYDEDGTEPAASFPSRRLRGFERSPKIVKIDTSRLKSKLPRRSNSSVSDESFFDSMSSTAQNTPRFLNSGGGFAPPTPAKSVCVASDGVFRRLLNSSNCPSYMLGTQSFEAKLPWKSELERVSLSELVVEQPKSGLSGGVRMERPSFPASEAFNFKSAIMGKLNRSLDLSREAERRC